MNLLTKINPTLILTLTKSNYALALQLKHYSNPTLIDSILVSTLTKY